MLSSLYTSLPSLDSLSRGLLGRGYLTKLSLAVLKGQLALLESINWLCKAVFNAVHLYFAFPVEGSDRRRECMRATIRKEDR